MKRFKFLARSPMVWASLGLLSVSCFVGTDGVEHRQGALTSAQQDVLGFEQPNLWAASGGSIATLSDDHTQGLKSLKVTPKGYVPYVSKALSSLGAVGSTLSYDLKLPIQQANPYWLGASQIFISIPSKNIYNYYAGQVELTGLPLNTWTSLSFALNSGITQTIGTASYTDLTFTIVLNVPSNATGTYLLDNLRFSPVQGGGTGGQGTGGQGTGGRGTGGQGTGGQGTGGQGTGGQGTGGQGTGGQGTGGQGTGGQGTGGRGTGGQGTGGQGTGGQGTGGQGTGGQGTGGQGTGGRGTGGQGTGGQGTGGQGTGGRGTGGQGTGGQGTGGQGTGGQGTGGQGTGGQGTGGQGTGGQGTGGQGTGGRGTGGQGTGGQGTGGQGTGGQGTGGQGTGGQGTGGQGTGGQGTGGQGTGGQGTGGVGGVGGTCAPTDCGLTDACLTCANAACSTATDGCNPIADPVERGLCEALYLCGAASTHPSTSIPGVCTFQGDATSCWCGTNPTTCAQVATGPTAANGPCLQQVFNAAHSTDPGFINAHLADPSTALGRAFNLLACRGAFCGLQATGECPIN